MIKLSNITPYRQFYRNLVICCLVLLISGVTALTSFSQVLPSVPGDSIRLRYPVRSELRYPFSNSGVYSPLYLSDPSNIKREIVYDPATGRYVFTEKAGTLDLRPPSSMSIDEYYRYINSASITDYWLSRSRQTKTSGNELFPGSFDLGQTFDNVFGADAISIVPQGSAELIFGYNMSRIDNPALAEKNRRNGSFLFKEKIQMNVTGSIGDKMQLGINYNTEASFDFENKTRLEYTGKEDEIIKKIEAGNVTFSLPGSLITGSQSLFGLKTDLQFGKLFVSTVFSHQRGQSQVIEVKGGAQVNEFEVDASEYDANRHFFLSQFFRDNYNSWLQSLPYVTSGVQIEQIEVWVTNKTSDFTNDTRNILAIMDIGESYGPDGQPNFFSDQAFVSPVSTLNAPVGNDQNGIYGTIIRDYSGIRNFRDISGILQPLESFNFYSNSHYEKIENARKLSEREYTVNKSLGYISLNSALRTDEVLAVAYVFTYRGQTYRVGELSTDGVSAPGTLIVKMLKGTSLTPKHGTWDLMMKNVYAIGAFQVSREDFIMDVFYRNDKTGVPVNYISDSQADSAFNRKILLKVLNMDDLDYRNEPNPDGLFDYIEGVTISPRDGRIFFTLVEPFGSDLRQLITGGDPALDFVADRYAFEAIYDSTQTKARQMSGRNKFFLAGTYQSSSSSEIQLNAMNVPQGSVKVTSGGLALVEGQDYTVDYTLGRVRILNQGLIESGAPIKVSLENNALFNLQTKTLVGTHLDYRFSDNFQLGATLMNLTERPLTQKVNIGDEPISNTIWGLNASLNRESMFITNLIDKLPLIETAELSKVTFDAEFAHLIPGQAKVIGKGGVSYIDDFEGTETSVELKTIQSWFLAATPRRFDFSNSINDLRYGYGRAKLAWYSIDPLFTRNESRTPDIITDEEKSHPFVREILETEIFKNRESGTGFDNTLLIMNLAYYPDERGPYNFDPLVTPDFKLHDPESRWAGIMREIQTNDFETSNIEYIEFWLMDPFVLDSLHNGGDLYINLGEISEDVLKDSRKSFENGLPTTDTLARVDTNTVWGRVSSVQAIVNTFDADPKNRAMQDVGLDGLDDDMEREKYSPYLNALTPGTPAYMQAYEDPSGDNFKYFLDPFYDNTPSVIARYKDYNNYEGNSPTNEQSGGSFAAATTLPNTEDINRDNTLNENESYYEYHVRLRPGEMSTENKYITEVVKGKDVNWYQYRIPVTDFENRIGNIEDFKSIRFMRIYLTGFSEPVILRFAEMRLVRSEWRKYGNSLVQGGPSLNEQYDDGDFEITSVNIEENSAKEPVNYILPPGIDRVIDPSQPQVAQLNEQAVVYRIRNLRNGDARGAYKNLNLDLRQYNFLRMFVHAEALPGQNLNDHDLTAFVRLGSDQTDNYYEYEVPLTVTAPGRYNDSERTLVWPSSNNIDIDLNELVDLKVARDKAVNEDPLQYSVTRLYSARVNGNTVTVKGNPNLSNIRTIFIGVRNASGGDNHTYDDGLPKSAEIWFNELRLTDFKNEGGWAANARTQVKLADVGMISLAGATSKPGFGSIEQKVDQRNKEETNQLDMATNIELGKLFPEKSNVSVPLYVGASKTTVNPEYLPGEPDRLLEDALKEASSAEERQEIKELAQDVVTRTSINLTNVRVNQEFEKFRPLSPSNFSLTMGYNQTQAHNYSVEKNNTVEYGLAFNYVYNSRPKSITPFAKVNALNSPYLRIIKDFNFSPVPRMISFRTDFDRYYNEIKLRNVYDDREILIDSTVSKDFVWSKAYQLSWNLTRSLNFDISISDQARIEETQGAYDWFRRGDNENWSRSVWRSIGQGGRHVNYNQTMNLTYSLPLSKIPFLNWTSTSVSYRSLYQWKEGPVYQGSRSLGNGISNSGTLQANATLNLSVLYNKVGFIKKIDQKYASGNRRNQETRTKTVSFTRENIVLRPEVIRNISHNLKTANVEVDITGRDGTKIPAIVDVVNENRVSIVVDTLYTGVTVTVTGQVPVGENPFVFAGENAIRVLTGFKNISLSYSNTGNTILMGFMPGTGFGGFSNDREYRGAPGLPFVLGYQDRDFMRNAAANGWLTTNQAINDPFVMSRTENVNLRSTFEPFRGFRLELTGMRSDIKNQNEYFYYSDSITTSGGFYFDNRQKYGSFSMSVITIGTAFEKLESSNGFRSEFFERFKEYRKTISGRLYDKRLSESGIGYQGSIQQETEEGYGDGYGPTSPDVVIPAFLAAYTGKDPDNITLEKFPGYTSILPNWRLTFDGLSRMPFFTQFLRSAVISHSYRSTYNINAYNTNFGFIPDETDGLGYVRDIQNNFIPELQINTVAIREEMNPFLGIDISWINSLTTRLEYRKSRILALSLSNNQLTESLNNELVIGSGYRFNQVPLTIGDRAFQSDLNLRFDLSIRDNKTLIRYLARSTENEVDQITAGDRYFKIEFTADYLLSPRFNLQLFFDRTLNKPHTSRSFLRVDTNIGFSLRFTLA